MKFYLTVNPHGGAKKGPKLLKKVKELAMRGIRFILEFFGFEVDKIKTSGLELFGY